MKFETLKQRHETARRIHSELVKQLNDAGGNKGYVEVSLNFSAMLFNAQKDLSKIERWVRSARRSGKITAEQETQILG